MGCAIGYGAAALTMPTPSPPAASDSPSGPAGLGDGAASDGGGPSDVAGQLTDLSYPDETRVKAGATIDKAWGLSNAGGVTWEGRRLVRITPADSGGARCSTPSEVPIPETAPGTAAEIHVPITMPDKADVSCRVEWKMVNKDGSESFPNSRPIYFLLFTER